MISLVERHNPYVWMACALLALVLSGCGAGGPTAAVRGKVVADGQPVTEGTITMTPVSGGEALPSLGAVNADGTFEMAIPGAGKGAALGKNQVTYTAPTPVGEWTGEGPDNRVRSKFDGYQVKETEIEVKSGGNDITVELVKP